MEYLSYLSSACSRRFDINWAITQPTIYRLIAYFSLYHELASDWSIVLDITWDYTMAWYPAQKINIQWPGTQLKRHQSYGSVSLCYEFASATHAGTGP